MNTFLSNMYLKLSHIDSRYIRLALFAFALIGTGGASIMGLPINGDLTG